MFFIRMLVVFLVRTEPASRQANPVCMKTTIEPQVARKKASKPSVKTSNLRSMPETLMLEFDIFGNLRDLRPRWNWNLCTTTFFVDLF